jgi:2'-5' RNA ligase
MNYRIVYLLKDKPKRYAEKLVKKVYKKFGVNEAYQGKNPVHITLKYRFETEDLEKVEEIVKKVCDSYSAFNVELGGVGSFNRNTLHLEIKPTNEMVSFEKELVKGLDKYRGDLFKFDKELYKSFHVGIAHHDIENKFDEIKQYLKKHNKKFRIKVDKIYLIKKPNDKWIIERKFKLKDAN